MALIQEEYRYPVDIEYTINISEAGEYVVNLLQCRPLQVAKDKNTVVIPKEIDKNKVFLECRHASMGLSRAVKLDYLVIVDPVKYYQMKYNEKYRIAQVLRDVNWYFRDREKHLMLLVPGRIGTSSPELGVPTTFADISEFDSICEVSEREAGYMPELSYGSHIFQDLVEAEILYGAVFDNEKTVQYHPEKLKVLNNQVTKYSTNAEDLQEIVAVYDVSEYHCMLYHDMPQEYLLCMADF